MDEDLRIEGAAIIANDAHDQRSEGTNQALANDLLLGDFQYSLLVLCLGFLRQAKLCFDGVILLRFLSTFARSAGLLLHLGVVHGLLLGKRLVGIRTTDRTAEVLGVHQKFERNVPHGEEETRKTERVAGGLTITDANTKRRGLHHSDNIGSGSLRPRADGEDGVNRLLRCREPSARVLSVLIDAPVTLGHRAKALGDVLDDKISSR